MQSARAVLSGSGVFLGGLLLLAACGPGESPGGEEAGTLASALTQAECANLAPSTSAATNRANIQGCLDTWNAASLQAGQVYNIDGSLKLGAGDVLKGLDPGNYSVIQPHLASAQYALYSLALINLESSPGAATGALLQNIKLNLRDARPTVGDQMYGIRVAHDNNRLERVEITSTPMPWRKIRSRSLYFGTGFGNKADFIHIHNTAFGVVFVNGNTQAMAPWVDHATLFHNRGDAVTFAGYGKLTNSTIHENGFDDGDSGAGTRLPPGGALYASSVNPEGGHIENNTVYNQCGSNIELNMTAKFTVRNNTVYHPGWTGMNGTSSLIRTGEYAYVVPADFCKSAMSVLMVATRDSLFQGNEIQNSFRPANTSANTSNGGTEEWFGANKADLPDPGSTSLALAFVLGRTHQDSGGKPHYAVNNDFVNNHMASFNCGNRGLGWFAGRSTGYDAGGLWDANTTANVFDDNSHCNKAGTCSPAPYTKRCGDNRYATGTATCTSPTGANLHDGVATGNRCNRDDFTHEGAGHDSRRNDLCAVY